MQKTVNMNEIVVTEGNNQSNNSIQLMGKGVIGTGQNTQKRSHQLQPIQQTGQMNKKYSNSNVLHSPLTDPRTHQNPYPYNQPNLSNQPVPSNLSHPINPLNQPYPPNQTIVYVKKKRNPIRYSQPVTYYPGNTYIYPYYYDSSGCYYCCCFNGNCCPCQTCHQCFCNHILCDPFPCCNGCTGFHCGCFKCLPFCQNCECVQQNSCNSCQFLPCFSGCQFCSKACDGACISAIPCCNGCQFAQLCHIIPCFNGCDCQFLFGCIPCCNENICNICGCLQGCELCNCVEVCGHGFECLGNCECGNCECGNIDCNGCDCNGCDCNGCDLGGCDCDLGNCDC